jgi:hypothetical protein
MEHKKLDPTKLNRRNFLLAGSAGVAGAWASSKFLSSRFLNSQAFAAPPPLPQKVAAFDTITLGKTGIRTSRLAMGTGTVGSGHHSNQTALGIDGLSRLLLNGYDHGLRFFDSADAYGSHPHVAEALKHVPRGQVTILTKTFSRDPKSARDDLDRFRRELRVDSPWTRRRRAALRIIAGSAGRLHHRRRKQIRAGRSDTPHRRRIAPHA